MTKTILVNKQNKIKESYLKKLDLVETIDIDNNKVYVEKETFAAYQALVKYLETKNISVGVASSYRSLEEQQAVYDEFIEIYGKEYADKTVAPVGCSEHHTGLAVDISLKVNDKFIDDNNEFAKHEATFKEIHKELSNFGFILRYPKGKEHITGYPYEPWHFRYVGKYVAKIIYENAYTLEEYLSDYSAILLVNKEKGMTSFDVVNEISHLYGIKRVGHTGTLDPLAEGVLIVAVGKATKVVELLTATYKEYIAKVKLGLKTDTGDITGKTLEISNIPSLDNLEEVLSSFKKTYLQEVPIYSAVKVNGKKLYEYARNNEKVELPKRKVTIKEITLIDKKEDTFTFKTLVSKGCYIRSLIEDIATSLNTCATMQCLTRTKQGLIELSQTSTLEMIRNNDFKTYQIDEVLDIPVVVVEEKEAKKIMTGQRLDNIYNIKDKVIFKDKSHKILGIYECRDDQLITWKNFV